MFEVLLITSAIALMFLFRDRDNNKYETVYSGDESTLSEANVYYWLLKNNKIPFKYQIPYNWKNFYQFGYQKSPVYIKVARNDAVRARRIIWLYRKEKMKMERNIGR
ncbi:hypothetical protein [Lentibacillus sp. Marseille-P4043]|uniref:hypothetical protein n=1 Tax=Lentibacillus sp. Marseille-P4043 TaxID=2040293 RepID=UPI000D0BD762|nr:hypothetical protein [Lentibacillus sp. Marseille-P4043]